MTIYGINVRMWYQDVPYGVQRLRITKETLLIPKYDDFVID